MVLVFPLINGLPQLGLAGVVTVTDYKMWRVTN